MTAPVHLAPCRAVPYISRCPKDKCAHSSGTASPNSVVLSWIYITNSFFITTQTLAHISRTAAHALAVLISPSNAASKHFTVSTLQQLHTAAHLALLTWRNFPTALWCIAWSAPSKPDHQFASYSVTCCNPQQPPCRKRPSEIRQQGQNVNITSFAPIQLKSYFPARTNTTTCLHESQKWAAGADGMTCGQVSSI